MTGEPRILLIDDEASEELLPATCERLLLYPNEEQFGTKLEAMLRKADLVLLDQNLQLSGELSLQATDGASLVGHLRSWSRNRRMILPPLVIFTSEYEAFAEDVPAVGPAIPLGGSFIGREARLAPTLDVEWLIAKGTDVALDQIAALARACVDLRVIAANDKASLSEIQRFIGLPEAPSWGPVAAEHLARARPPVGEPSSAHHEGTRGATPVLRWLLTRALPYPGLFISDLYAAWTLGIELASLGEIVKRPTEASPWAQELLGSIYAGPASALFPQRWWAAGVDFAAWKVREESERVGSLQAAIDVLAGPNLRALQGPEQVVIVDMDLNEIGLANLAEAMQLHPPGWPTEATEPWMHRDLVAAEPLAQAMVDPADRALFE